MNLRARYRELPYEEAKRLLLPDSILPRQQDALAVAAASCGLPPDEFLAAGADDPAGLAFVAEAVSERLVSIAAYDLARARGTLTSARAALLTLAQEIDELQALGVVDGR